MGDSVKYMCQGRLTPFVGDGHPPLIGNPCNWYITHYYWVDEHPLLYGNKGSLDPGTHFVGVWNFSRSLAWEGACPATATLTTKLHHQ